MVIISKSKGRKYKNKYQPYHISFINNCGINFHLMYCVQNFVTVLCNGAIRIKMYYSLIYGHIIYMLFAYYLEIVF